MPRRVLCYFKWVTEEKESNIQTLTKGQDRFTTKDTKSTKASDKKRLHPLLSMDSVATDPVYYTTDVISKLIKSPSAVAASILRALRVLRGKLSLSSILHKPQLIIATHSKHLGTPRELAMVAACVILLSMPALAQTSNLIGRADASFDRWNGTFSFSTYETQLREALALYEEALSTIAPDALQTRSHVLNRLAQGYFELGMAYLSDHNEQEEAYSKGKDYALESLRLDPAFVEAEKDSFRAALRSASDVRAIFWYGNNLGRYLNFHPLTALSGGMKDVQASFERAIELDPAYLGAGPWRALGSFLAQIPTFIGGDPAQARVAFDNAIAAAPEFLENYIDDADYIAQPAKDWGIFCSEIKTALAKGSEETAMAKWPLYNALALQRAQDLAEDHPCGD